MKGFQYKYLVFLLIFLPEVIYCQAKVTVTKPRLEVSNENLVITYDILNTKSTDFFIVWLEVTDAAGNKIKALSITGDVGDNIKGGKNKKITWNFINDSIFIDDDLYVAINAEKVFVPEETVEAKKTDDTQTKTEDKEVYRTPIEEKGSNREISKSKMVITSTVLPGWGQTKLKNGKPFWIIGAAGYGCIAGSVFMNRSAASTYDDYKSSMDVDESNTLFDKATMKNNLSKALGYSAIGIWAADLIWVLATPVRNPQTAVKKNERKLKVLPGFDASSNIGIISITYNF